MLFGDSYKKWQEQLLEYLREFRIFGFEKAEYSTRCWIAHCGLKWCCEEEFEILLLKHRRARDVCEIKFNPIPNYIKRELVRIYHEALKK